MRKEEIHRYIPIIILLALISVSLFIIKGYIVAIIGAFIVSYLIYPVHKKLAKKMPQPAAASLTIAAAIIIVILPIILIVREIISQISKAIQSGTVSSIIAKIENLGLIQKYNLNLSELTSKFFDIGVKSLSNITLSVAASIVSLFVMVFVIYYLLVNWVELNFKIKNYIPFNNKDKLIREMAGTTTKIIHGTMFIALLEALVAAVGFWLAGINFFLVLAALIALFAFIPGGPAVVWVPALIIEIVQGSYISATIILVFGLFMSVYLDVVLRTKIAGKSSGIHPVVMLLGVIGGTPLMGLAGIVVGPLLLSYTLEILEEVLSEHPRH